MNDRDESLKVKAATQEYDSPVDEARSLLQYIEDIIDRSLSSPMFTLSDKAELAEEKKADLEKEKAELQLELETRKLVERSKGILQRELGLSAQEAHLALQQRSHHSQRPIKEIAQAIILSAEIRRTAGRVE